MTRKTPPDKAGRTEAEEHPHLSPDPFEEARTMDRAADATARDMAIGWRLVWARVKRSLRLAFSGKSS